LPPLRGGDAPFYAFSCFFFRAFNDKHQANFKQNIKQNIK